MKAFLWMTFVLSIILLPDSSVHARDFLIFNVTQDLPMGLENEIIRKNYYVNIGSDQGLKEGTKLNVFRRVSKFNPYENKKRVDYKVKIGELEVLHASSGHSIARTTALLDGQKSPILELKYFMIGDHVTVFVD